jgi:hypothetical protein
VIASPLRNSIVAWLLFPILLPGVTVSAQEQSQPKQQPQPQEFTLGVKAGALLSLPVFGDRDDYDDFDLDPTFGYQLGGIIGFPLKKNYSCIIEGGFSQRGRRITWGDNSGLNRATYSFFEGDLLLRRGFPVNLGKDLPAQVFVNIGPHVSYWISGTGRVGNVENDGSPYTVVFDQEPDLGQFDKMYLNNVNRWMFGIDIGVGLQAPITPKQKLLVELRFMSGHTFYGDRNSATYSWVAFQDNLRANEKILSLSAGYTFGLSQQESRMGKSTKDKEIKRKPVKKKKPAKRRKSSSSLIRIRR